MVSRILNASEGYVPFVAPWEQPWDERLRAMCARKRRIAYFYERPDTSTFRYRVFNMVESVNVTPGEISSGWFTHDDKENGLRFIEEADALVISRVRYDHRVAAVIARARTRGIPIWFDTDDLVFDIDQVHDIVSTLGIETTQDRWNYWYSYVGRIGATMKKCDAGITTTSFLAERLADVAPFDKVSVIPNFLNRSQQKISELVWQERNETQEPVLADPTSIKIGYFSGSDTHKLDLLVASPALAQLFETQPKLRFKIVGFCNLNEFLQPYADRIEFVPLTDYWNLQREIGSVDINISPLRETDFTQCKSELKYFEAGVVGVPTIATPTLTFANVIKHGENGFLAKSWEWLDVLSKLIDLIQNHPAEYQVLCTTARDSSLAQYGWGQFGGRIASTILFSGS